MKSSIYNFALAKLSGHLIYKIRVDTLHIVHTDIYRTYTSNVHASIYAMYTLDIYLERIH